MNEVPKPRVAIVGAGLTGLTAAWRLQAAGATVKIFEKSRQVGGHTVSIRKAGFVFDVGAITMLPTYVHSCALIDELGIAGHLHRITPAIGIPRDGVIHRIDVGHPLKSLLGTRPISTRSKFKLLELLRAMLDAWNRANYQSLAPLAAWNKETIASYVRCELGDEIHEHIKRQFLSTIKPLPSVSVHLGLRRRRAIGETFILPPRSEQKQLTTIVMDHLKRRDARPKARARSRCFAATAGGLRTTSARISRY